MKSSKSLQYAFVDYDFYRLSAPLLRKDMSKEEKAEIQKKVSKIRSEIEKLPIGVPRGVQVEFKLVPVGELNGFVGSVEIQVVEQGFEEWAAFIHREGGAERFIQKIMSERRERTIEKVEELEKEIEKNEEIDVRVLGKSGTHRVYGKRENLKCDCKLFENTGECHHVALVKTLLREGLLDRKMKEVEPPIILWRRGKGETEYDRERNVLSIHMDDENKTRTIRLLHNYGYGLGAMKEMQVVPRRFKFQQLMEVLHGASYDEVMEKQEKEELGMDTAQEMEMEA